MASLVSALAKATGKTATAPIKDAREFVSRQVDPTKSIYGLGLGVGPLIRQTVSEYKRQREADKNRKEEAKEAGIDRKAIKSATSNSASSLSLISKQLNNIAGTMREVRDLNRQQLRLMRGGAAGPTTRSTVTPSSLKAADDDRTPLRQGGLELFGDLLGGLKTAGLIGAGGILGSLLYSNREEIKKTLDEFFKGAGLGSTDEVIEGLKKDVKDAISSIGTNIGKAISESVDESLEDLKEYIRRKLRLPSSSGDGSGDGSGGSQSGPGGTSLYQLYREPVGAAAGGLAGASLGLKMPGPWPLKLGGAVLGGIYGSDIGADYPEATVAALLGLYGAKKTYDWYRNRPVAGSGAGAPAGAGAPGARVPSAAPSVAGTAPPPRVVAPVPNVAATPAPVPGFRPNAAGILLPESAGRGPRSIEQMASMAKAAADKLSTTDRFKVHAQSIATDLQNLARNPVFQNVMKHGGRIAGALGIGLTLNEAYTDIENGDWEAATVRISGLLASLGLATAGSAFMTPLIGVGSSIVVGVGSNVAADRLRKNRGGQADLSSLSASDPLGNFTGISGEFAAGAAAVMPRDAPPPPSGTRPAPAAAAAPAPVPRSLVPVTPPAASSAPSAGRYSMPVDNAGRVVGALGEPRPNNRLHQGVDIAMPVGTPVKAIADGRVLIAGQGGGYGNYVRIVHKDGRSSLYAHLDKILVKAGQEVKAGQQIGTVGMTGATMGPHLHLEIYDIDGDLINPRDLLPGLPAYSGSPVPGVPGAENFKDDLKRMTPGAVNPAATSGVTTTNARSLVSQASAFSNPFDTTSSSHAQLERMGFSESEIPQLLEAQRSMRDLMNLENEMRTILLGGGSGGETPSSSVSQSGGNNNTTPPTAMAQSDFEKDRLVRLNLHRSSAPAWALG